MAMKKRTLSAALNAIEKRIHAEFAPQIAEARRLFLEDAKIASNPSTGCRNAARHANSSFRRLRELEQAMESRLCVVDVLRENRELIEAGVVSAADVLKDRNDGSLVESVSELGKILGRQHWERWREPSSPVCSLEHMRGPADTTPARPTVSVWKRVCRTRSSKRFATTRAAAIMTGS
jgi:hypothetical protein